MGSATGVLCQFCPDELSLLVGKPFDIFGKVGNDKEPDERDDASEQAFDDENPPPATVSSDSFHFPEPTGQQATEGTSECRRAEEKTESLLRLAALIPHPQQVEACMRCWSLLDPSMVVRIGSRRTSGEHGCLEHS